MIDDDFELEMAAQPTLLLRRQNPFTQAVSQEICNPCLLQLDDNSGVSRVQQAWKLALDEHLKSEPRELNQSCASTEDLSPAHGPFSK